MAVHVLALLAYHQGDRLTSAQLAESINTNPVIVRRLLLALQRARLVETSKGLGAGSRLTCSPRKIDLAQVYRAVEAPPSWKKPPRKPNAACPVGGCVDALLTKAMEPAQQAFERELAKVTIADMVAGTI
jgi:Rrf2 family protein